MRVGILWASEYHSSVAVSQCPIENLAVHMFSNSSAGSAGALARRRPEVQLPFQAILLRNFSRFALNAGEGARAPSRKLESLYESMSLRLKCERTFSKKICYDARDRRQSNCSVFTTEVFFPCR